MRLLAPLCFAATLLPAASQAADAMCEYRHPDHPSWDFFAACTVETATEEGRVTTTVTVRNGSRFTTIEADGDEGPRYTVNDLAATRLDRDPSRCYLTDAEAELVCIHPPDTPAPEPQPASVAPAATSGQVGFGGGTAGYCLLTGAGDGVETLTEYGACVMRENCVEDDAGATTCLSDYDWGSGRRTEMARASDWLTLDGGVAQAEGDGCVRDPGASVRFCFSRKKMTAADHPVLATVKP